MLCNLNACLLNYYNVCVCTVQITEPYNDRSNREQLRTYPVCRIPVTRPIKILKHVRSFRTFREKSLSFATDIYEYNIINYIRSYNRLRAVALLSDTVRCNIMQAYTFFLQTTFHRQSLRIIIGRYRKKKTVVRFSTNR